MSRLMDLLDGPLDDEHWPDIRTALIAFEYAPAPETRSKFGDPDWWSDVEDRAFPGDNTMDELQCSGKLSAEQLVEVQQGWDARDGNPVG